MMNPIAAAYYFLFPSFPAYRANEFVNVQTREKTSKYPPETRDGAWRAFYRAADPSFATRRFKLAMNEWEDARTLMIQAGSRLVRQQPAAKAAVLATLIAYGVDDSTAQAIIVSGPQAPRQMELTRI